MKNIFKICLLAILLFSAGFAQAQTKQYAYIDATELIQLMPETATAYESLDAYSQELQTTYEALQTEFNTKYTEYAQNLETYTETMRSTKETELQDMQERIQTFSSNAETNMTNKQNELMTPIYTKVNDVIQEVAAEQGVTYVFDASALLYKSSDAFNLLPFVKEKLGIQ